MTKSTVQTVQTVQTVRTIRPPLTDSFVKSAAVTTAANISDPGCKGLYLRVTPEGAKTWAMIYRSKVTGKLINKRVGSYPAIGLKEARALVNKAWVTVELGAKEPEFTLAKQAGHTVAEAFAKYCAEKVVNLRQSGNVKVAMTTVIERQKWGPLPLVALKWATVKEALVHIYRDRGAPGQARNVQQMFSTFLKWCAQEDLIEANPLAGRSPVSGIGKARERRLTEQEIRQLWHVCHNPEEFGLLPHHADALLLLLTTTARTGMICGLRDSELVHIAGHNGGPALDDVNEEGPLADFPKERMKKGRPFVLPLNSLALAIIRRRMNNGSGYMFPSNSTRIEDKGKHIRVRLLSAVTMELCERLGWTAEGQGPGSPFTPHDLRRTGASLLRTNKPKGRGKYTRDEVGLLLSHEAEGSDAMKHYDPDDRWDHLEEKRELSDWLATILKRIVSGAERGGEVKLAA